MQKETKRECMAGQALQWSVRGTSPAFFLIFFLTNGREGCINTYGEQNGKQN